MHFIHYTLVLHIEEEIQETSVRENGSVQTEVTNFGDKH